MGIIYKYTAPNGKIYIGQTRTSLEKRQKDAFGSGYIGSPKFYNAIQYYGGLTNFQSEILIECENEKLDELEQYYINKFQSNTDKGYNIDSGGQGQHNNSPVDKYSIDGILLATYSTITEASEKNQCSISCIIAVLKGRTETGKGYRWVYHGEPFTKPKKAHRKKVYQFDLSGQLIMEFESCRNADRYYNLPFGTVASCANRNSSRRRVGEYVFTYDNELDYKYYKIPHSSTTN